MYNVVEADEDPTDNYVKGIIEEYNRKKESSKTQFHHEIVLTDPLNDTTDSYGYFNA